MKKLVLGVVAMALVAVSPSFAAADTHSSSSYMGHELLFGTNGSGNIDLNASTFTLPLTIAYQRMFMPNIQLGLRGNMTIASVAQAWTAQAWLTYNLEDNLADSMFIGVGPGIAKGIIFVWGVEVGKRFELAPGLMYRPTVEFAHTPSSSAAELKLNFLNFSYVW